MTEKEFFEKVQNGLGRFLSPFEIEDFQKWFEEGLAPEVVYEAVRETELIRPKNHKTYLNSILRRYLQDGITTVEALERQRHKQDVARTNVPVWSTKPVNTESTPEGQARLQEIYAELEALEKGG